MEHNIFQKPIVWGGLIVLTAFMIGGYFFVGNIRQPSYTFATTTYHDITATVTANGQIHANQEVTLSFDMAGKIRIVGPHVGTATTKGTILAALNNEELDATLAEAIAKKVSAKAIVRQARANEATQQARLNRLQHGTRKEQLAIYETATAAAVQKVSDAKQTYANTIQQANMSMTNLYEKLGNTIHDSDTALSSALTAADNILGMDNTFANNSFKSALNTADISLMNKAKSTYSNAKNTKYISDMLIADITTNTSYAVLNQDTSSTQIALNTMRSLLNNVSNMLNTILPVGNLSQSKLSTLKSSIITATLTVNTSIATLDRVTQEITTQQSVNVQALTNVNASVHTAEQVLQTANDTLALAKAGATNDDIVAQKAVVQQTQAAIAAAQASVVEAQAGVIAASATFNKSILRAPFAGVITMQNAKIDQSVLPGSPIVELISTSSYQFDLFIDESDIDKVHIGQQASVTVDTYGNKIIFPAVVTVVAPGETTDSGAPAYKVTIQLTTSDSRIKSGMTGSVSIVVRSVQHVLSIPDSAIIHTQNHAMVLTSIGKNKTEQKIITIGLKGNSGYDQVLSGLKEGNKVVMFGIHPYNL